MRYSEDIDLVQRAPEPIGDTLELIRRSLDAWLGEPKRVFQEGRANLVYRFGSEGPPVVSRDDHFLQRLDVSLDRTPRREFWPSGGPVWDGLARTTRGDLLLVEAKAHIPEIVSPPSGAGTVSLAQIARSLEETRQFLNARSEHSSPTSG